MFPGRCLFSGCRADGRSVSHPCNPSDDRRSEHKMRLACRGSAEHLRLVYQFDVDKLRPVESSSQVIDPSKSMGNSCSSWRWEHIDLHKTYVPPFYHAEYIHPSPQKNKTITKSASAPLIPCTPHKVIRTVPVKPPSFPQSQDSKPLVTLLTLWRPRIRRSLLSECPTKVGNSDSQTSPQTNFGSRSSPCSPSPSLKNNSQITVKSVCPRQPTTLLRSQSEEREDSVISTRSNRRRSQSHWDRNTLKTSEDKQKPSAQQITCVQRKQTDRRSRCKKQTTLTVLHGPQST